MKFHALAALAACTAVVTLAGCAATAPRIDPSQLANVRKGETTVAQVVSRFGRPSILSKNIDGTQTAAYMHAESPSSAASALAFGDSTVFYFDEKGVLSNYRVALASVDTPTAAAQAPASSAGAGGIAQPNADPSAPAPKKAPAAASGTSWGWSLRNLQPSGVRENR